MSQQQPTIGKLTSSPMIQRYPGNPILGPEHVPYGPSLVFNVGVTKFNGKYVMAFRNDYESTPGSGFITTALTDIGLAFSDDGIHWSVQPKPCFTMRDDENLRAYDPRLTVIDGRCYSACTLVLGMIPRERLCVTSRARLGFHAAWAYAPDGSRVASPVGNSQLWDLYPPEIRGWIVRRGGLTPKLMVLSGRELTAMYRACR